MSIKFLNGIDVDNGVLYTDTSNNRVGINTSSPQVPLEVKYTGSVDEIIRIVGTASGKPQLNFYNDTTLHTKIVAAGNNDFSISNTHSTGDMFFATGGSTRLHIEANGNVGIGTTSPSVLLHVQSSVTNTLKLNNSSNSSANIVSDNQYLGLYPANYIILGRNTLGYGDLMFLEGKRIRWNETDGTWYDVLSSSGTNNLIKFGSITSVSTGGDTAFYHNNSEKMRLTSTGLGIGTTSPTEKLDVNGSGIFTGSMNLGNGSGTGEKHLTIGNGSTGNGYRYIDLVGDTTYTDYGLRIIRGNTGPNTTSSIIHRGTGNLDIQTTEAANLTFRTSSSEKMRIASNGNVGIGTTSPSEKLGVFGNIRLENGAQRNIIGPTNENLGIFANPNGADEGILFSTDNGTTTEMIILNGGNVGIGKTNPSVKLHIGPGTAPSSTTEEFRIQTGVSGGYGGTAVINLLTGQYGNSGIYFGDQATYSNQPAFIEFQDSPSTLIYKAPATSGSHVFKIGTSEQVKIAYNGYVGIGMSNPGAKLHVGVSTGSSSTTQEFLLQTQSGGYGGEAIVNLRTGQYGTSGIYFGDGLSHTSQPAYLKFIDSSNSLGLKTTGTFSLTVNSSVEMYVSATGLGVGTTSPGEKLEVNGTVKATATTDAYKGYIKNTINTIVHEKSASADFNYVPFNTVSTGNSNQYYNAFVAPYNGRVKKIHVRHSGGNTPTATAVRFKKQVNGTLSSTQYQATISNGATTNMQAEYNFSNSDFTFNEGDLLRIAMQTSDAFGTGSRTMGGGAVAIVLEYNIT